MKEVFKKIIAFKLAFAAKLYLWRLKPEVIAITGSAGKTSTKEFLKKILEVDFNVLSTEEGYNTDIGAPLSLFHEKVPESLQSPFAWMGILGRVYKKALFSNELPEKIIVEMGADKPGDIKYLASIFRPQKSVILTVLPVHMSQFKNIQAVAREKAELAKCLPENGMLFLNYDDQLVREMGKFTKAKVYYFGTKKGSNFQAEDLESSLAGLSFSLKTSGQSYRMKAPIYGQHLIYSLLAAISVGSMENIGLKKITETVKDLRPFKGRMNVLEGLKGSIIIDDSYNANPKSTIEALDFLNETSGRKIAVLGNMNELGVYEVEGHEAVGRRAAQVVHTLVTVGDIAGKIIGGEAAKNGLNRIKKFTDSTEAGQWLASVIKEGDVVLIKGSQNKVRLERAVAEILAHPEDKMKVLVRQSNFWNQES